MPEQQHRRAGVTNRPLVYWQKLMKTELLECPPAQQGRAERKGRWDPYERFTSQEDITKFFSGYSYRREFLIDRERFAKFVIGEALGPNPVAMFDVTGEIMKNESVSAQASGDPDVLTSVAKGILAEGQLDVDAESPKDLNPRVINSGDIEATQKIGAAAQAMVAASPNSLGPPIKPCVTYLMMTKCGTYGRKNSNVWKSPLLPNLDFTRGRRGLLDHQVTAIVWLLSRFFGELPTLTWTDAPTGAPAPVANAGTAFERDNRDRLRGPKYFGGILADSMGLGKTLITVALMDLLASQRLNVVDDNDGRPIYRPILLLTPNATVANQWVQEIDQVINESVICKIVVSGTGLEVPNDQRRIFHLGRENFKKWPASIDYMWNENDPRASQVVLVVTMETWASRTCAFDVESKEWVSSFTEEGRAFSLVIVDEAYKVKNPATKNWRSLHLLERQFTLLITATPCMNTLTDIFGLARLLWSAPQKYLKAKKGKVWDHIERNYRDLGDLKNLDEYESFHDYQLVAGRPAMLSRLLCKARNGKNPDVDMTRKYLKYFETLAMLKRSPSSYVYADWDESNPVSLEGLFPQVENYTVDISLGEAYDKEYQQVHVDILIDYLEGLSAWAGAVTRSKKGAKKDDDDKREPVLNSHRLLQLASSSLDLYDLDKRLTVHEMATLAPNIAELRDKGVNFLRLSQFMLQQNEKRPDTHVGYMKLAVRNSPILRFILHYIKENILTREEKGPIKKLLIIEQNLLTAFYYELVLQFLGFECRCMHAHLSVDERQKLVDSFNSSDNGSCQILIQLYSVGFAGTNLHKSCSRVLVASQAHSLQVQWQAIYRVIRVGQNSDVTVHRLKLKNSYHAFRESRQIEKILPELGARAQGNTRKVLVRLLNLFQYEIHDAWNSPEGIKLRTERNLLNDDVKGPPAPPPKKIKLEKAVGATDKTKGKQVIANVRKPEPFFVSDDGPTPAAASSSSSSKNNNKRARDDEPPVVEPKPGNGKSGWFKDERLTDHESFLMLRTRDAYYEEFVALPRRAKSMFGHEKNSLRRLLSYGNENGELSLAPWTEVDLGNAAVLERALELMLRVRLGAREIAMLPFPLIDISRAPEERRKELQRLLREMVKTDQDFDQATIAAAKDLRETLRGSETTKSLGQIERDLDAHARTGDGGTKRWVAAQSNTESFLGDEEDDEDFVSSGRGRKVDKGKGKGKQVAPDYDYGDKEKDAHN